MAGLTEEAEIRSLQMYAYRLSRALIGNELADRYNYPKTLRNRTLVLLYYRLRNRLIRLVKGRRIIRQEAFGQIFESAQYDKGGISYNMPDHVRASQSSQW